MKKVLALVLAAMMVLTLAACAADAPASSAAPAGDASSEASKAEPAKKVELEYWFEGAGAERTPTHTAITDGWNAANPNIQVEAVYVDLSNLLDKINVAWAGGAFPDIVYLQSSSMSSAFIQGMFIPLDEQFAAWDEKDQFDAGCLDYIRGQAADGKLYAIPTATNITGIWYRKDLFAAAGVEAPTTWDNFFTAIEKTTDPATGVYGHTLRGGSGSVSQLVNEIICYAGIDSFFDAEGKAQILRSDAAKEYVERFAGVYQKGYAPESSMTAGFKEMVADFNANLATTLIHNLGSYENQSKTFTPDQYGFYPFPVSQTGNGRFAQRASAKGIGIGSTCKNPAEAWEYTKWNCSEDAVSAINEAVGEMPTRADSASHEWVQNAPHMSNLPAYAAEAKVTVAVPDYLPDYSSIQKTEMEPVFQEVLAGKQTAEAFLTMYAEKLEAAQAEYEKNIK